jgi:hypothetical protein
MDTSDSDVIRAERMRRRYIRAEARRLTLTKYQAHLKRVASTPKFVDASGPTVLRVTRRPALNLDTRCCISSRPMRSVRPRERRAVSRARARAPDPDEPEPPDAAAALSLCPGCGSEFRPRRPNQVHCQSACRVRALRRRRDVTPIERYYEQVWEARRAGEINGIEAFELLLQPSSQVLARLAEVAA